MLLSKLPILAVAFEPFCLNGHALRIDHGDFYSGKGLGVAVLDAGDGACAHVYTTHTIASYAADTRRAAAASDRYHGHRVGQHFEIGCVLSRDAATWAVGDYVVLAGDLNAEPDSLEIDALSHMAPLVDVWATLKQADGARTSKRSGGGGGARARVHDDDDDEEAEAENNDDDAGGATIVDWTTDKRAKRIDYVWAPPDTARSIEVVMKDVSYSDHNGLVTTIGPLKVRG